MRFNAHRWLVVTVLGLSACGDKKSSDNQAQSHADAVAQVGGSVITVGDIEQRINSQSPFARGRYKSPDKQKELLDEMVRLEVLSKEAERRGLNKDPELSHTIKQLLAQRLLKDELSKVRMEDITESAAQQYYDAHAAGFNQPEQVQVAWIVVKDANAAKRVLSDPRIKMPAGDDQFRNLVAELSQDDVTRAKGGLLPFFNADNKDLPQEVVTAGFNLTNPGDVSPPVKTDKGVVILKLVARKRALERKFEEMKQQIRNIMYREAQEQRKTAFEAELRDQLKVQVDTSKLSQVRIEGAADEPSSGQARPPMGGPAKP